MLLCVMYFYYELETVKVSNRFTRIPIINLTGKYGIQR